MQKELKKEKQILSRKMASLNRQVIETELTGLKAAKKALEESAALHELYIKTLEEELKKYPKETKDLNNKETSKKDGGRKINNIAGK